MTSVEVWSVDRQANNNSEEIRKLHIEISFFIQVVKKKLQKITTILNTIIFKKI